MKIDSIGTWVGVLIGLPAFLALFLNGLWVSALLVLILIVALIAVSWFFNLPEFTIIRIDKTLTLCDAQGKRSRLVRRCTLRPNHKGINEYWVRNIGANGSLGPISIDGKAPDEKQEIAGVLHVCKRYHPPLERWKVFDTTLEYEMDGAFTNPSEIFIHYAGYSTKDVTLVVEFPQTRTCAETRGIMMFAGEQKRMLEAPTLSSRRDRAEWRIHKPKKGAEYHFEWDW